MDIPQKPKHNVGDYVFVRLPLPDGTFNEWAGNIMGAYWETSYNAWVYRISKRLNYIGAEARQEYIISNLSNAKVIAVVASKKFTSWDFKAAQALDALIQANLPKPRTKATSQADLESWADDFRKLRDIDKLDIDEIKRVLLWCQQDNFWSGNILSAGKFRKQFDRLQRDSLSINRVRSIL